MQGKRNLSMWICLLLIFISRLPFISAGYGAEEDAWGLRITAEQIAKTGIYEVSRLPGHPFQELIYSSMWQYGPMAFNLLTLLLSTMGIAFFMLSVKKAGIQSYLAAGTALAFTPVIYINSMNAMDYTWAFSFMMIAFFLVMSDKLLWAGLFLGLAVGCRITSGAMLIPFLFYLTDFKNIVNSFRKIILIVVVTLIVSCLLYWPVYHVYGSSFFSYYEYFPIPSIAKNIYKGTIGVWGIIGCLALILVFCSIAFNQTKGRKVNEITFDNKRILLLAVPAIVIYTIAFCMLPLKSAFLIPLIPFVILMIALFVKRKWLNWFAFAMMVSSFTSGVNLANPNRGVEQSSLSTSFNISGQKISFDPLTGPVIADYAKQKNMISFSRKAISRSNTLNTPSVIIAGWYLNFIVALKDHKNGEIVFVYYIDEAAIRTYIEKGYHIYYLTEQDQYNDLRFHGDFTRKYAIPLFESTDGQKP